MKTIIVYYSMDGNTKEAAEKIAEKAGADLLELKPLKPLPAEGGKKFSIGGMQALFGMCPGLQKYDVNMTGYKRIIIGCPVWAGKCAPYINTFLKDKYQRKKVTAVFTLSGGGDNDRCIAALKKRLPALKTTVALADRKNEMAKDNDKKIEDFVKSL